MMKKKTKSNCNALIVLVNTHVRVDNRGNWDGGVRKRRSVEHLENFRGTRTHRFWKVILQYNMYD